MERLCDLHRQLYNAALEERIDAFRKAGKSISFAEQCKSLTLIRQQNPEYLAINAQSAQVTLKRLDKAFAHRGAGLVTVYAGAGASSLPVYLAAAAVACGDLENDQDLDLLADSKLYENHVCNPPNTAPEAPQGLQASVSNDTVVLAWQKADDLQTMQNGLTYNLRVGTTPGGNEIVSSLSDPSGWRKIAEMGNAYQNTGWWLHNLEPGTYYWSVQAIDNSFAGGPFAPEQTFVVQPVSRTVHLSLFLEGLFNPATGQMNKAQDENGDEFPGTVADRIRFSLALPVAPFSTFYSVDNIDLNQDGTCSLSVPCTGYYYLVIKHRNSIETWSSSPVYLLSDPVVYDFASEASRAYGDNLYEVSGKWLIYGADVNQDGLIDSSDMLLVESESNDFAAGYLPADVNGDGIIDSSDMLLIEKNADNFVSSARP